MASNEAKTKTPEEIMADYRSNAAKDATASNGLKLGDTDAIKPRLSDYDQTWLREYQELQKRVDAKERTLKTLDDAKKYDTPEGKELRKDLLQAEYQQNHYVDEGYQNERVKSEMNVKYIRRNEDKMDGMIYSNDGKPPQPDISDSKVAHKVWLSEKVRDVKAFAQDAKAGFNKMVEDAKPYAKETMRATGATAIDSIAPTPSKLLPLPKTHLPQMDYLRDGIMDDAAGRTGIPSPGNAVMDKVLGPPPGSHKKQPDNSLGLHSSIDESFMSNANNRQMVDAFLYGNPQQVIKEFPSLASAYTFQAATQKTLELGGYHPQEQVIVMERVNANIANSIQAAQVPQAEINSVNNTVTAQRESGVEISRGFV